jgi:hypothetical protein
MPGKKIELKRSSVGPICDMDRTIRSVGPTNILEADKCPWRNRIQAGGQVGTIWMSNVAQARVEVRPGDAAKRLSASRDGVSAETAQFVSSGPFDYRFCAPVHLLIACERAVRSAGETSIGRSLKSSRHDFSGTLSLVPAGDEFCGTFVPRVCPRTAYIYLSPKTLAEEIEFTKVDLTPRPFFENAALWQPRRSCPGWSRTPERPAGSMPRRAFRRVNFCGPKPPRSAGMLAVTNAVRPWLMLSSISAVGRCSRAAARAFPIARSALAGRTLSIRSKASGQTPIASAAPPPPPSAISCLGASRTPATTVRG